jgi:hypothetical protein
MTAMKTSLFVGSVLGALLLAGTASAAEIKYHATLTGAQENPAVDTDATGEADFTFNDEDNSLTVKITYSGMEPNTGHIHKGACGQNGSTVSEPFDSIGELSSPIEFQYNLEEAEVTALVGGELYVNLHSEAHSGGEIRGQIVPDGQASCGGDAGASSSSSSSSGSSGDGGGSSSSGTGGGSDAGASSSSSPGSSGSSDTTTSDSGCSTTNTNPGSGLALALGVGIAVAAVSRNRRKR